MPTNKKSKLWDIHATLKCGTRFICGSHAEDKHEAHQNCAVIFTESDINNIES